jgi:Poly(ADP-ribose) polymerase and DNA-Ligase Zn-finger region
MAETIEVAKTGRARCRVCRQPIEKGALRFGEEQPSAFGEGLQWAWHHLTCAAKKKPAQVRRALESFTGEVPDRPELEALLESKDSEAASEFPHAERAPTGRSRCLECKQPIEKDALRVAIERQVDLGGMARASAGYLHPRCAKQHLQDPELLTRLRENSRGLSGPDLEELEQQVAP